MLLLSFDFFWVFIGLYDFIWWVIWHRNFQLLLCFRFHLLLLLLLYLCKYYSRVVATFSGYGFVRFWYVAFVKCICILTDTPINAITYNAVTLLSINIKGFRYNWFWVLFTILSFKYLVKSWLISKAHMLFSSSSRLICVRRQYGEWHQLISWILLLLFKFLI